MCPVELGGVSFELEDERGGALAGGCRVGFWGPCSGDPVKTGALLAIVAELTKLAHEFAGSAA